MRVVLHIGAVSDGADEYVFFVMEIVHSVENSDIDCIQGLIVHVLLRDVHFRNRQWQWIIGKDSN